jgi:hypothetical protein
VVGLIVAATAGSSGAQQSSVDARVRPVLSFDVRPGPSPRLGLTVRF